MGAKSFIDDTLSLNVYNNMLANGTYAIRFMFNRETALIIN